MIASDIKKILSEIGVRPNKLLGQHFLIDDRVLQTIVETADIHPGDRVLEVGPGLGVLTEALVGRGASVIAIEQDRGFAEWLLAGPAAVAPVKRLGQHRPARLDGARLRVTREQPVPNDRRATRSPVEIIQGDAARLDWDELMGGLPWKFISNLPYGITSLALRKALWPEARRSLSEGGSKNPPTNVVVLVQREVAERAVSVKKTSLLSLMVALASHEARIVRRVSSSSFYPPPKVESAILQIVPMAWEERRKKWGMDPERVMQLAKKGFAHPRKKLFSNLGIRSQVAGFSPSVRAEDLSPEEWAALARILSAA